MENLRWARIFVKMKRGELPSSLEIGIEGIFYNLPLWGDEGARAGWRVEEWGSVGLEALSRTTDGMEGQMGGTEQSGFEEDWGPSPQFLSEGVISKEAGVGGVGPAGETKGSKGKEKPGGPSAKRRKGPAEAQSNKGPMGFLAQPGLCGEANFELEFLKGEFFDHFGVLREVCRNGSVSNRQDPAGPRENGNDCWELVEFNGPISVAGIWRGGHPSMSSKKEGGKGPWIGKKRECSQWLSNESQVVELEWVVSSLGSGRFLDWKALDACGSAGGILICWDKRVLDLLEWEEGQFSLSCRFRIVDNGVIWVFTGVYDPFTRVRGVFVGRSWAVIRGIWEGALVPWGEVFGNLECNKEAALQQVEYWDRVEGERSLTVEELACKKEAKEGYAKWVDLERNALETGVVNAFQQQFSESSRWRANIGSLHFNQICLQEAEVLELPFTEGEVQAALMDMNGDKAPGPDGFSLLKKVIGKVVSPDQNAFVTGRQILDASLIANEVMEKMGFGSKWLRWMWWCISTVKFSVMVNGAQLVSSPAQKGCVKGTPSASGLRINLAKSEIIPIGEVEEVDELAVELGCRVGQLPAVYLGLPLGVPNKAVYGWDGVEEKVRRRLALWKGGFGIRKLTLVNKVLRDKWIWRFACDKEALWKQVLVAKYGQKDYGWRTKKAVGAFGMGVWKEILKEAGWCWEKLGVQSGKGNKIRFWTDTWCGDIVLSQRFSHLYILAAHRNASVEEMWDQNVGEGGWNLRFIRDFNDWEVEMVDDLLQVLRGFRIIWREDLVFWKGGGSGQFRVKGSVQLVWIGLWSAVFSKNKLGGESSN
ncbi:hypothetical protein CK203_055324 [Vitis vinifera]|uniref:Uncharacterized protein n=1 Tax=Vitis vinifera TaxID=29760 RepID=A0A438GV01_VITVI|nr:hypothetical protein CK203_055324 [Vitis vinifera]